MMPGIPVPGAEAAPWPDQNRQIFDIYTIYRLVLSLLLLLGFFFGAPPSVLGSHDPTLFLQVGILYALLNALALFRTVVPGRATSKPTVLVGVAVIDILLLTLLSHACGGVSSGFAHLLIVPVAAGSLVLPVRMSIFLAAVGSIAVIYSEIYLFFARNDGEEHYMQAGLLGLTLFAAALAIQLLGGRLRRNERLAAQQAARIQSLLAMNDAIIQRMRTGILVVDAQGRLLHANGAAHKLLMMDGDGKARDSLPAELARRLANWERDREAPNPPFRLASSEPQVQASFAWLNRGDDTVLIFLEDYSQLTSKVQQLKLVSLGRLTASIAHEVRNPLGAISHAGQLLKESPDLSGEDARFVDIILNHSGRVNAIIENILKLSRHKGEVPALLNLEDWLPSFVDKYMHTCGNNDVQIDLQIDGPPLRVRVNPTHLEQIIGNLCDNGARYSRLATGRGQVIIAAGMDQRNPSPYLDVIDHGDGVASEDEEQIFEPFYTTENTGTGLGLYICREICEANQARLFYRRTAGHKSCFRVLFAHPDRRFL